MRFLGLAFLFFMCALPLATLGAVVGTSGVTVSVGGIPEYPTPGQTVTLRAYALAPKGTYTYIWTENGNGIAQGIDLDSITFTAGNAGSSSEIRVILMDQAGTVRGQAAYLIRPAEVDILWEGDTYVPPFYKGKPYPTEGSTVTVVAVPHFILNGKRLPAETLVYEWEAGGKKLLRESGYGSQILTMKPASFTNNTAVAVTVRTRDNAIIGRAQTTVPTAALRVIVYEKKPLAGLWHNAALLGARAFEGDEMTFQAIPFYTTDPRSLTYAWRLAGQPVESTSELPGEITFRKTGEGGGIFPVEITVERAGSRYDKGSGAFDLSFEE